ncbi:MAG: fatty acid desaturase [Kiloniellales bacterium]
MKAAVRNPGRRGRSIEWPTVALIVGVYLAFALLTWFHAALPLWLFLPCAIYIGGFYGHLQHEVIHGHPTANQRLNALLIFPSLWLWIPYRTSRHTHLTHHRDLYLTCPEKDPESFYVTPEAWAKMPIVERGFRLAMNSFAGRLLLSPPLSIYRVWADWLRRLAKGDRSDLSVWLWHFVAIAIPLAWACWICGLPVWVYLLGFAYGGAAVSAMRSFLEHQAAAEVGERICVVESNLFFSLLFLYNNLHIVHHKHPGLAWYRIPARWQAKRDAYLALNGSYYFRGYGEVARRYLFTPKEHPVHPGMPRLADPRGLAWPAISLPGGNLAGAPYGPSTQSVPAKPV